MTNQHGIIENSLIEVSLEPGEDYGFVLKRKAVLYVHETPKRIVVSWPELGEWGEGQDVSAAVTDLVTVVCAFHDFLQKHKHILSKDLRKTLATFDEVIGATTNNVS
mgnify:CR=1 FL=1